MRLRKRTQHVSGVGEDSGAKRKINIGRYLYFLIFALIMVFLVVKWGKGFVYVKGYGQIKISRLNVQEITDIRVLKMMVEEGQKIKKGEILFSFTRRPEFFQKLQVFDLQNLKGSGEYMKFEEQLSKMTKELNKKLKERRFLTEEIRRAHDGYRKLKRLVLLKIETEDNLEKAKEKYMKLLHQRTLVNEEIHYLSSRVNHLRQLLHVSAQTLDMKLNWKDFSRYTEVVLSGSRIFKFELYKTDGKLEFLLKDRISNYTYEGGKETFIKATNFDIRKNKVDVFLKGNFKVKSCATYLYPYRIIVHLMRESGEAASGRVRINCTPVMGEVFRSPFTGMVTRIYFDNYEVALKGEKIMAIFQPGEIHIKGFFEQKDLKYLKTGDSVTIEFPDSSKYEGKIARLYYASLPLPPEFQKKYEPVHRSIVADIIPDNFNLIKNKEIEKLSVTLWVKKKIF